jgi:MATE family multidrug resistance protein
MASPFRPPRSSSEEDLPTPRLAGGLAPAGVRDVLRFAWPTVLSFVAGNLFRVNDQFWVKYLGPNAQAALGAVTFLMVLNFAAYFLTISGSLSLVSQRTGAGDVRGRDEAIRAALQTGSVVAALVGGLGWCLAPWALTRLGLEGEVHAYGLDYVRTIYLVAIPIALAPLVDSFFVSMGDTRTPFLMQLAAVVLNFCLNPVLIYEGAPWDVQPGDPERLGMTGAALATGASRALILVLGLVILARRDRVAWAPRREALGPTRAHLLRTGLPSGASIAVYAGVYLLMIALVFDRLPVEVLAALGIGFNAFEGIAFPFYLGVAVAGSSLVGRNLGAGAFDEARRAVRNVRRVGVTLGVVLSVLFVALGPTVATWFGTDPVVVEETARYARILAVSQVFVAIEAVSEKTLLAAGNTRPIFWITGPGNLLRVPLAWWLALELGWGALGIWWAINVTTALKSLAMVTVVERGGWRRRSGVRAPGGG